MSTARSFGEFRLDETTGRLLKGDRPVPLTPKAFAVLQYLVERPGHLITKKELHVDPLPTASMMPAHLSQSAHSLSLQEASRWLTRVKSVSRW